MTNNKLHDEILGYITDHGETGVNTLANAFDVPLSTMQKFLTNQSYFKKTERRKWDLPENVNADVKSDTMTLMVDSLENSLLVLKSQITDLSLSLDTSLIPISTLKRGIHGLVTPVAAKSSNTPNIDPILIKLDNKIKEVQALFKKYVGVCPKEYQDLIKNVDLYRLMIEKGSNYLNGDFNREIGLLFLEKSTELNDEAVMVLKEYQKEA